MLKLLIFKPLLKIVLELVNNIFLVLEPNKPRPLELPHIR